VASILDLAVVALAVLVCTTLALLAWTLGVTIPAAVGRARQRVVLARLRLVTIERRLTTLADAWVHEGDE
jgi:hypothetical protein